MNDFIESLVIQSKQQTTGKRDEILHSCKWAEDDVQRSFSPLEHLHVDLEHVLVVRHVDDVVLGQGLALPLRI